MMPSPRTCVLGSTRKPTPKFQLLVSGFSTAGVGLPLTGTTVREAGATWWNPIIIPTAKAVIVLSALGAEEVPFATSIATNGPHPTSVPPQRYIVPAGQLRDPIFMVLDERKNSLRK